MTIGDYIFYSVVGLCVVFCVLILLMFVIKLLMAVSTAKAAVPATATAEAGAGSAQSAQAALAPGSAGEVMLFDTDPRDAAMVMAIVADELQKPLNELRFISIREVKR